jgi:arginyl-tRNA--protein-N-Asp/Glu arginylyltransferase
MDTLFRFVSPPGPCSYLPSQRWQLEYEIVSEITPGEYQSRLKQGWRRFGFSLFHPVCDHCTACRSLRVIVDRFSPDRSQRRARKANDDVTLTVGPPAVTDEKLELYDRYHAFQAEHIGWSEHAPKEREDYIDSFTANPFPTEEWCYYVGDQLIGVGYVDALAQGLSAIYFFYEPQLRDRSLGTYNVLRIIEAAAERRLPHVYLGYFVADCRSLEYKARFRPNEIRGVDGQWQVFRE